MAQLFGFQITRVKDKGEQPSFVLPDPEDGATTSAGFYSEFIDIEGQTKSESDLIRRYRSTSDHPECDLAIEDIVNEAINTEENKESVSLNVDKLPYSSKLKSRIKEEFQSLLQSSERRLGNGFKNRGRIFLFSKAIFPNLNSLRNGIDAEDENSAIAS